MARTMSRTVDKPESDPSQPTASPPVPPTGARKALTPAAARALAEAEARRKAAQATGESQAQAHKKEIGGRKGPDPTRYGDWEKDGIAHDF